MTRIALLCTVLTSVVVGQRCCAQSMFTHRQPGHVNLFADLQARQVGDLLTIVIRENTAVDNKDERLMEKETEVGGSFNFDGSISGNSVTNSAASSLDSTKASTRGLDGTAEYSVQRAFLDRVTVQVLDILPNGNLVVGGKRRQLVAGELRVLVVSGIVRPFDIATDNSVESRSVANLEVAYQGKGPDSSFTNQGWLGRLGNKLWPF